VYDGEVIKEPLDLLLYSVNMKYRRHGVQWHTEMAVVEDT